MIIDCAVYADGERTTPTCSIPEAAALVAASGGAAFAWIGLHDPTERELEAAAGAFGFHTLAIEDACSTAERPKIEHIDGSLSFVVKSARYKDAQETVDFGQVSILIQDAAVLVVRSGHPVPLVSARQRLEGNPALLRLGPGAVLYQVLHEVVDQYSPVLDGLENDVVEVEDAVFGQSDPNTTQRIYFLLREVLGMQRAASPLLANIQRALTETRNPTVSMSNHEVLQPYYVDVQDSLSDIVDRIANARELLDSALAANLTQVSLRQNSDMRKMSAWAALLAIPTMIAGIYGMNFDVMPELHSAWGYPIVLAVMGVACTVVYRKFRDSGWL